MELSVAVHSYIYKISTESKKKDCYIKHSVLMVNLWTAQAAEDADILFLFQKSLNDSEQQTVTSFLPMCLFMALP